MSRYTCQLDKDFAGLGSATFVQTVDCIDQTCSWFIAVQLRSLAGFATLSIRRLPCFLLLLGLSPLLLNFLIPFGNDIAQVGMRTGIRFSQPLQFRS